jgi:hypothetical protein
MKKKLRSWKAMKLTYSSTVPTSSELTLESQIMGEATPLAKPKS